MTIQEIIEIAEKKYESKDYIYHILPVVENARLLTEKLDADAEVVEIAAYFHDLGRAVERENYIKENEHHIIGAEETRRILEELKYPEKFIEKVEHCVLTHRGRKGPNPETLEAEIIANADAMAHFDTFLDLFSFFLKSTDSFEDAVIEIEQKVNRNWNKKLTLPEAKEIVGEKYEAITLLLKGMKDYMKQD